MRSVEQGFLLLTSHLGDMQSKPLTVAGFRTLLNRVKASERSSENRDLNMDDLIQLGYDRQTGENILYLLSRKEQMEYYVNRAAKNACVSLTRASENYPGNLRIRLGTDCPGCLWLKGDMELLKKPAVSLVGSRDLNPDNKAFAEEVGRQAAKQDYVLISGNARGADRTAQDSCLKHGGQVISIVADSLTEVMPQPNILYISEDGFDCSFSSYRALSRNRLIHAMGKITLVAQCSLGKGGTWDGCKQNLRHRWSPVFCFQDGSKAATELTQMGASAVDIFDLADFARLQSMEISLFNA